MELWSATSAALLLLTLTWRLSRLWSCRTTSRVLQDLLWVLFCALAVALVFGGPLSVQDPRLGAVLLLACSLGLAYCRERALVPPPRGAVLVTGCDSGFGHSLALQLSHRGVKVFAGVLHPDGDGASRLREQPPENMQVLQLDVTNAPQVEVAHRYISTQVADAGLWGLVNNAGVLLCPADAELQPLDDYRRCLELNFVAVVRMCQVFLPLLRRSGGRIINVSSLAGEVPMPLFAAYSASKAALSRFTGVLQQEMRAWGVDVCLIQPTGFRTGIFGNSESAERHVRRLLAAASPAVRADYGEQYIRSLPAALSHMAQLSTPDFTPVVDAMLDALLSARPRPLYTPGQMGWLLPFLHRCCPTTLFHVIASRLPPQNPIRPAALHTLRPSPP